MFMTMKYQSLFISFVCLFDVRKYFSVLINFAAGRIRPHHRGTLKQNYVTAITNEQPSEPTRDYNKTLYIVTSIFRNIQGVHLVFKEALMCI